VVAAGGGVHARFTPWPGNPGNWYQWQPVRLAIVSPLSLVHLPLPMSSFPAGRHDARVLGLSALGGALEFYDFVIFVFFTRTLGELFFPAGMPPWLAQLQVYSIFAAGYLVRPLGGLVMAHFGDRLGRKRMFTLSLLLMALPTLLIGLLPTYARLGAAAPLCRCWRCACCRAWRSAARCRGRGCSWPSTCRRGGWDSPRPACARA
jgi:hypothetical protein